MGQCLPKSTQHRSDLVYGSHLFDRFLAVDQVLLACRLLSTYQRLLRTLRYIFFLCPALPLYRTRPTRAKGILPADVARCTMDLPVKFVCQVLWWSKGPMADTSKWPKMVQHHLDRNL